MKDGLEVVFLHLGGTDEYCLTGVNPISEEYPSEISRLAQTFVNPDLRIKNAMFNLNESNRMLMSQSPIVCE